MKLEIKVRSRFSVPVEDLFSFHEKPIGFQVLVGADPKVKVIQPPASLAVGSEAILSVSPFPGISVTWTARHTQYEKNKLFVDEQVSGPFSSFVHYHQFFAEGSSSILEDKIHLEFLFLPISQFPIKLQLLPLFRKRHRLTAESLNCSYTNLEERVKLID